MGHLEKKYAEDGGAAQKRGDGEGDGESGRLPDLPFGIWSAILKENTSGPR